MKKLLATTVIALAAGTFGSVKNSVPKMVLFEVKWT